MGEWWLHCTMHTSSQISAYCINQTRFLLPTLSTSNSPLTQVASGAWKRVLFYLVEPKFSTSDMSVLWGKNVPWNTYACLRRGEVRSTSLPLCTDQWVCRLGHPQRRRRGSRTGKTFWKQDWEGKGLWGLHLVMHYALLITVSQRHIFFLESQYVLHIQGF